MKTALILIDLQNDYFPNGKMELNGSVQAVSNAKNILELFRKNEDVIIHVQHLSIKEGASFFLPNTEGVQFRKEVSPLDSEYVVQKYFPNSFRGTNLLEILHKEEITHLVVCGMMSHMCVDATVRAAFDLSFSCTVVEDACATKDLVFQGENVPARYVHQAFMGALEYVYAKIVTAKDFIYA